MATTTKKYLDLEGLQKLKNKKAIVVHPTVTAKDPAAVKVGTTADGHVVIGDALRYNDLDGLPTIGNGALTIQVNGKTITPTGGTFTANKTDGSTYNITAADLGLASGMRFVGISTTDPKGTSGATISGYSDWRAGDVVLYKRSGESNYEEYILTTSSNAAANWELLGDADSYALKTVSISAGTGLTGGGTLASNRTISHATTTAADAAAVKVGRDELGHVVLGGALGTVSNGAHTHSVTVTTNKEVATGVTPTTTNLGISTTTEKVQKGYTGTTSNLLTTSIIGVSSSTTTASKAKAGTALKVGTANVGSAVTVATRASSQTTVGNANVGAEISITGVSGSVTASKATAGTAISVAKVGSEVTYGTADCDTTVTGIAKVGSQITYGNANVGSAQTVATGVKSATATTTAYTASYDEADYCLVLSAATVTPTVTLNTTSITPATTSSSKAYACAESNGKGISVSITPAKASTKKLTPAADNGTITPWTFEDVTVPKAASAATVFNPATNSTTKIYAVGGTTDITPAVEADASRTITPYTFDNVTVPIKAASSTTVATGSASTDGNGAAILTGITSSGEVSVVKSASITTGNASGASVVTGVSANTETVTSTGTAASNGAHTHNIN